MINIGKAMKSNRILKSLTGLNIQKFQELVPSFENILLESSKERVKEDKNRERAEGGGKKHTLDNAQEQLFYILFYLKVYPTFDVAGFIFDVDRSQTCRWMHKLLPLLEQALERTYVLPKRKISSMDEFIRLFPEVKDIFVDATERAVQRPVNNKKQNRLYSGKKKKHTRKNTIVSDEKKRILVVTKTTRGSMHDKKQFDKSGLGYVIPKGVSTWTDTGYQGIDKIYDIDHIQPKKRTKGKSLTPEEKEENRVISSIRVVNEQAIGGIKRMNSTTNIYRNKRANTDDKFMVVSAGIWNLLIA
jgi:hypothetical protein